MKKLRFYFYNDEGENKFHCASVVIKNEDGNIDEILTCDVRTLRVADMISATVVTKRSTKTVSNGGSPELVKQLKDYDRIESLQLGYVELHIDVDDNPPSSTEIFNYHTTTSSILKNIKFYG